MAFDQVESVHSVLNDSGAPAGYTGSPGDGVNCTSCHFGTVSQLAGAITSTIPSGGYVPGQTYTITITASEQGVNKWGFQLSPQNGSGTKMGNLLNINSSTKILVSGKYASHTSSGTSGNGGRSWEVNWTAPAAGSGAVTFYASINAANGDDNTSGDKIYLTTLTVQESATSSTAKVELPSVKIYPNPVGEELLLEGADIVGARLLNALGAEQQVRFEQLRPEVWRAEVGGLKPGVYFVQFEQNGLRQVERVFIR